MISLLQGEGILLEGAQLRGGGSRGIASYTQECAGIEELLGGEGWV